VLLELSHDRSPVSALKPPLATDATSNARGSQASSCGTIFPSKFLRLQATKYFWREPRGKIQVAGISTLFIKAARGKLTRLLRRWAAEVCTPADSLAIRLQSPAFQIPVPTVAKVQSDRDPRLIPSGCVIHKRSSLSIRSNAAAASSAFSSNLNF
jgi:hypothetical protein